MEKKVTVKVYKDTLHYDLMEVYENEVEAVNKFNSYVWSVANAERYRNRVAKKLGISLCSFENYEDLEASIEDKNMQSPEEDLIQEEEKSELIKTLKLAIRTLTPRQQEMVYLVYFKGVSQNELAEKYGIKKSSVSDAMQRIYASLKNFFEKNKNILS